MPFTLLGASKDAVIYIWCKKPIGEGLLDVINDAAHVLDISGFQGPREAALSIESSGALDNLGKWVKSNLDDNSRRLAALEERKRFPFINLGDMEYDRWIRRRLVGTVEKTAKVNQLTVQMKLSRSSLMDKRRLVPRTKDYMKELFGWMDGFDFHFTKECEFRFSVPATVGRSPSVARFEQIFGFSTATNDQYSRMTKLFLSLNDNGFAVASEFTADTLISLFTRPDIYPHVERIASVAVRLGALDKNAQVFAN